MYSGLCDVVYDVGSPGGIPPIAAKLVIRCDHLLVEVESFEVSPELAEVKRLSIKAIEEFRAAGEKGKKVKDTYEFKDENHPTNAAIFKHIENGHNYFQQADVALFEAKEHIGTPSPTPTTTPSPMPTPSPTPTPSPSLTPVISPTPTPMPTPSPTPTPPGFEAIFVIAGLLAVAYLLRRRK